MKLKDHADETAQKVISALGVTPTDAQRNAVVKLIEDQLVDTAIETRHWCADHASERSTIDREAGRQLAEELHAEHEALITNLSSMR